MRQPKIVIVGAGPVGGSAARCAAVSIPGAKIVVADVARARAERRVLDLAHAAASRGRNRFYGKGATHYGIASAIGRICQAIVHNTDLILTVGIVHPEVEGVPDVSLSLPMVINGSGAHLLAYPELSSAEREALQCSAQIVKAATDSLLLAR